MAHVEVTKVGHAVGVSNANKKPESGETQMTCEHPQSNPSRAISKQEDIERFGMRENGTNEEGRQEVGGGSWIDGQSNRPE
eukprot:761706-Hanusia_phi.AAC.7